MWRGKGESEEGALKLIHWQVSERLNPGGEGYRILDSLPSLDTGGGGFEEGVDDH